jgi:hypothetical protein
LGGDPGRADPVLVEDVCTSWVGIKQKLCAPQGARLNRLVDGLPCGLGSTSPIAGHLPHGHLRGAATAVNNVVMVELEIPLSRLDAWLNVELLKWAVRRL